MPGRLTIKGELFGPNNNLWECCSVPAIKVEPAIEIDSKSTSFYVNKQPAFRVKQHNTRFTVKRQKILTVSIKFRKFLQRFAVFSA